eukprot:jgi/Mesvir1/13358/Mv16872-RA.1
MAPTNASVTAGKLLLAANVSANGTASWVSPSPRTSSTSTEPNLWKLDTYTGTAPNYSTVDSVSALNLVYSSSGAATTSWLGEWFTDSANNNTATGASVQNYGNGLSGNFQGVTPVSSEVTIPTGLQALNTRYVTLADIETGSSNSGTGRGLSRQRNESAVISAPNHVSGCFQTFYGTAGYLTSNYSKTSITRGSAANGSGVLVTGIVKPITSLASATGGSIGTGTGTAMTAPFLCGVGGSTKSNKDMVELLTVGDPATAGAYVSVWAWRSGRILMFNGTSYTETVNPVVGSSEFVLGVHLSATEPQLFINGQLKSSSDAAVMLPWRTIAGNVATTISAANTGAILSSTASARGVYLGPRSTYDVTSTVTTPTLNVGYKNWRLVDTALNSMTAQQIADTQLYRYSSEYDSGPLTVTYGFRIADDETLQIVKTQGSMASTTNTMLGNILPVSEDGTGALTVNSLGAIGSSTVDPVMDLTNKR